MKQAIGSTWVMQLVIVFMLIFVAFLALSINYTKAFRMKNEVLSILEKYEGASPESIRIINNYLRYQGYHNVGTCDGEDSYGVGSLDSEVVSEARQGERYFYCLRKIDSSSSTFPERVHYEVETFFKFNLPVVGDLFTFRATGTTIDINWPNDDVPTYVG